MNKHKFILLLIVNFILLFICFNSAFADIEDTFDRPDNTTLGTATNGNVWSEDLDTGMQFQIRNNQSYFNETGDGSNYGNRMSLQLNTSSPSRIDVIGLNTSINDAPNYYPYIYLGNSPTDSASTTATVIFLYRSVNAQMAYYDADTWKNANYVYSKGDKINISFRNINYTTYTFDLYVDDTLELSSASFQTNENIDYISVVHTTTGTDDLVVEIDCITTNGDSCEAPAPNQSIQFQSITLDGDPNFNNEAYNTTPKLLDVDLVNQSTSGDINTTLYLYNSTNNLINTTQIGTNTLNITYNLSFPYEDNFSFYMFANNGVVNKSTSNYTVSYDITPPVIQQIATVSNNTFLVNFSNILNVTDALSGLDSCLINITELENVSVNDTFLINCTDTQVFSTAGLHNALVTATDNANNSDTYSFNFTIIPLVYIYFKNSLGSYISNYSVEITHPDTRTETRTVTGNNFTISPVNNGTLDLGNHTITFNKSGYVLQDFTININESSGGTNYTFNASDSIISVNIKNKDTGNIITGVNFSLDFIATVGLSTSTITGKKNVSNIFFLSEQYILTVTNTNYKTEQVIFDFNNQELIELDVYMIDKNDTSLGYVKIKVVDRLTQPIENAEVQALQWFPSLSNSFSVSESLTGSDGIGNLNIILDDKTYIFRAILGTIFADSIQQTIDTVDNGKTITITLALEGQEKTYLFQNLIYSISESFNNVTNISTITVDWTNTDGLPIEMCINSYRSIGTVDSITSTNCIADDSSSFVQAYYVNSSYTNKLKVEVKVDTIYYTLKTFTYNPTNSVPEILKSFGFHVLMIPMMFMISVGLGILLENIFIGTMLLMISSGVSLILAPSLITGGIVAFLFFFGFVTLWGVVKPK